MYIMLYIMLAYLMLLTALSNAVCLYYAFFLLFLPLNFANAFVIMLCLCSLTVYLFQVLSCIIHSAFNLLVFPNSMFTPFFHNERAMCSL